MPGASKGKRKPSRDELLSFLNSELARQESGGASGMNRWVLLVGIAALGWEAIRQLTPWPSDVYSIVAVVYLVQIGLQVVTAPVRRVAKAAIQGNFTRVFDGVYIDAILKEAPFTIGISAAYLLIGIYVFWDKPSWLQLLNLGLWGTPVVFDLATFLVLDKDWVPPLTQGMGSPASTSMGVSNVLRAGCAMIISIYLLVAAFAGSFDFSDVGVKVAVLASAGVYLVAQLGDLRSSAAIARSIRGLIVAITFDHIKLKDAYARAEAIFVGAKLDDVLAAQVNAFIKMVDGFLSLQSAGSRPDPKVIKKTVDSRYLILNSKLTVLVLVMKVDKTKIDPLREKLVQKHAEFNRTLTQAAQPAV